MMHQFSFILLISLCFLAACSDENTVETPCQFEYNRQQLFSDLADKLILPGYNQLEESLTELQGAVNDLEQDPSQAALETVETRFITAWRQWQQVAQFGFGPAETEALRSSLNPFPTNESAIDAHLASGSWDLNVPMTFDKGFPALDYLLFGEGSRVETLAFFQNDPHALAFLAENVDFMLQKVEVVKNAWDNNYRSTFINNTGTAAGSSLSLVVNSLNEHYEMIKRDKLGIPLGVNTLGIPNPEQVEAPHSGLSLELLALALDASEDYFLGFGGQGLDDYLDAAGAQKDGQDLSELIEAQYQQARASLGAVDGELKEAVTEDVDDANAAYEELTRVIPLIKTDMPSMICVAITYIDNPSDSD